MTLFGVAGERPVNPAESDLQLAVALSSAPASTGALSSLAIGGGAHIVPSMRF